MHHRTALVTLLLSAACREEDDPAAVVPEADPDDPAVLADCDESDFQAPPFMGAGFDPETGLLLEPLPATFLVATTVGWSKADGDHPQVVQDYSTRVIEEELFVHEGLIGATFGLSESCGSARTLTLWRDEASLTEFVTSPIHSEAMQVALPSTRAWETTHWTESGASEPPGWDDARSALEAARPVE